MDATIRKHMPKSAKDLKPNVRSCLDSRRSAVTSVRSWVDGKRVLNDDSAS